MWFSIFVHWVLKYICIIQTLSSFFFLIDQVFTSSPAFTDWKRKIVFPRCFLKNTIKCYWFPHLQLLKKEKKKLFWHKLGTRGITGVYDLHPLLFSLEPIHERFIVKPILFPAYQTKLLSAKQTKVVIMKWKQVTGRNFACMLCYFISYPMHVTVSIHF